MTLGRLTGDRVVDRFGQRRVVRVGGALTAAGMGLALAVPSIPTTLLGFALAGLGVATLVPAVYHAADELPGLPRGLGLAVVNWLLRIGFLVSPPLIGVLADADQPARGAPDRGARRAGRAGARPRAAPHGGDRLSATTARPGRWGSRRTAVRALGWEARTDAMPLCEDEEFPFPRPAPHLAGPAPSGSRSADSRKSFGPVQRRLRPELHGRARLGHRLPRPERGREDHDPADGPGADAPRRRDGDLRRHALRGACPPRCAPSAPSWRPPSTRRGRAATTCASTAGPPGFPLSRADEVLVAGRAWPTPATAAPAATRSACASGSPWPPRCSATPPSWCWTSRPTAWTPRASSGCAASSATWRTSRAARSSCPATCCPRWSRRSTGWSSSAPAGWSARARWSSCARAPTAPARCSVRGPEMGRLAEVLRRRRHAACSQAGRRPSPSPAARPPTVGHRAFAAGIELHELRPHTSGLEEIYFQLTSGSEQFAAPSAGTPVAQEGTR